jgi:hypothetical protein
LVGATCCSQPNNDKLPFSTATLHRQNAPDTGQFFRMDYINARVSLKIYLAAVAYPGILFGGGGVQQIQLRTEDRQNGDLGAVAP